MVGGVEVARGVGSSANVAVGDSAGIIVVGCAVEGSGIGVGLGVMPWPRACAAPVDSKRPREESTSGGGGTKDRTHAPQRWAAIESEESS